MIPLDLATLAQLIKIAPAVLPKKKQQLAPVAEETIKGIFALLGKEKINPEKIEEVLSALSTYDIEVIESRGLLPDKKITIRIKKTE